MSTYLLHFSPPTPLWNHTLMKAESLRVRFKGLLYCDSSLSLPFRAFSSRKNQGKMSNSKYANSYGLWSILLASDRWKQKAAARGTKPLRLSDSNSKLNMSFAYSRVCSCKEKLLLEVFWDAHKATFVTSVSPSLQCQVSLELLFVYCGRHNTSHCGSGTCAPLMLHS